MEIRRDKYLNRLVSRMNNGMIKVITGIRRSGKSFLLFNLFYKHLLKIGVPDENIIRISLDSDEFEEYRNPKTMSGYIRDRLKKTTGQVYVLIDEIQFAISGAELAQKDAPVKIYSVLNGLLGCGKVDVYVTGSNSKLLSKDVMTEFRGRGDVIHIQPLSFSEYFPYAGKDRYEALKDYFYYGGLPHILEERTPEDKVRYLSYVQKEIFFKDISERYSIGRTAEFDDILNVIASSIGSLINPQKIYNTFLSFGNKKISLPTINEYISYMEDAFIVNKAVRCDIKGRKYIGTPFKYYFSDLGIRNCKLNFRQYEETHIMENVIYNELLYRGFSVDVGNVFAFEKNDDGKSERKQLEIDFVANKGSRRFYIQSAYSISDSEKLQQEIRPLLKTGDSFAKVVVTHDNVPFHYDDNGIAIVNMWDFLLGSSANNVGFASFER